MLYPAESVFAVSRCISLYLTASKTRDVNKTAIQEQERAPPLHHYKHNRLTCISFNVRNSIEPLYISEQMFINRRYLSGGLLGTYRHGDPGPPPIYGRLPSCSPRTPPTRCARLRQG